MTGHTTRQNSRHHPLSRRHTEYIVERPGSIQRHLSRTVRDLTATRRTLHQVFLSRSTPSLKGNDERYHRHIQLRHMITPMRLNVNLKLMIRQRMSRQHHRLLRISRSPPQPDGSNLLRHRRVTHYRQSHHKVRNFSPSHRPPPTTVSHNTPYPHASHPPTGSHRFTRRTPRPSPRHLRKPIPTPKYRMRRVRQSHAAFPTLGLHDH